MPEDQQDFLSGESMEETHIKVAKELLLERGYRVIDPIIINTEINNQRKLCDYFYMRLESNHPNRRSERSPNNTLDMQMISRLVKSRMATGLGEKAAIQECISIIDTIFNSEEEFKFKYPVMDTTILGQDKMGWITSKALKIMDDKKRDAESERLRLKSEEVEQSLDSDLRKVENKLDTLLRSMEDDNGKKEIGKGAVC